MTRSDEHLWEEEVVEIFLDPDRSGRDYYELEISPANVVCDLRMISPWPNKKSDFAWNLAGLETRVARREGRRRDARPAGRPPRSCRGAGCAPCPRRRRVALPPKPGDRWRFNVFRIERPGGKANPEKDAVSGGVVAAVREELPRRRRPSATSCSPARRGRGARVTEGEPRLDFRDMTEADLADGLRLSRASGWNQTLEDWRLLLSLGPGLFRVGRPGRARRGLGRRRALRRRARVDLHDPGRPRAARPRPRHADLRRGARPLRGRGAGRAPPVRGPRRDPGRPRHLRPARLRRTRGPASCGCAPEPTATADRARRAWSAPRGVAISRECWPATARCSAPIAARSCAGPSRAAPDLARARRRRVRAYCFGRHGDHSDQVGPVVAEDASARSRLVRACLSRPRRRPLILDARVEPAWLAALGDLGFREQRPFTRMYLGDARPPARPVLEPASSAPSSADRGVPSTPGRARARRGSGRRRAGAGRGRATRGAPSRPPRGPRARSGSGRGRSGPWSSARPGGERPLEDGHAPPRARPLEARAPAR